MIGNAITPATTDSALPITTIFRRPTQSDSTAPMIVVIANVSPPAMPSASTVVRGRPSSAVP